MLILKEWLKSLLSVFVFLRYRFPMELYEKLMREKRTGGLLATVFVHYMERHGGFIGLGASFAGRPYFPHGFHGVFISEQSVIGRNAVIF